MDLIMDYWPAIVSLTCLQMVGLISPGPDFAVVLRNSLIYSRKTALFTALGIALGIMVHVAYSVLGLGFLMAKTAWLLMIFKYVGAGYLLYIGYKGLRAKKHHVPLGDTHHVQDISPFAAFRSGFLTNALNPKAMLFFVSLFSLLVAPSTPPLIMGVYSVIIFITTLGWFSFVALCLSGKTIRAKFNAFGHWIERVTGGLLILLGIKLLLMKADR